MHFAVTIEMLVKDSCMHIISLPPLHESRAPLLLPALLIFHFARVVQLSTSSLDWLKLRSVAKSLSFNGLDIARSTSKSFNAFKIASSTSNYFPLTHVGALVSTVAFTSVLAFGLFSTI